MKLFGWRITFDVAPPWRRWRFRAQNALRDLAVVRGEIETARNDATTARADLVKVQAKLAEALACLSKANDLIEEERAARARAEGQRDAARANMGGKAVFDPRILN